MNEEMLRRAGRLLGKFLIYTAATAIIGILLLVAGLAAFPESSESGLREPSGLGLIPFFVGGLSLFGSPLIAFFIIWRKQVRAKKVREAEENRIASEMAEREALRRRFFERERLIDEVDKHRAALIRNLERAVRKNDYGAVVEDRRVDAVMEFFASIDLDRDAIDYVEAAQVITDQLAAYDEQDRSKGFDSSSLPFDGYQFEQWVASALRGFGWDAEVTAASGDQGIDVVASNGGKKLGLQCKLYSSPIGNKAIQEAYAGKAFHGLDRVGVLSNADFTSSAKELASRTGVLLLSHHDIPRLHETAFRDSI